MDDTITVAGMPEAMSIYPARHIPCGHDSAPKRETGEQATRRVLRDRGELWHELAKL